MKKLTVAAIAVLVVSLLALAACSSGGSSKDLSTSKYVGTWKATELSMKDASDTLDSEWVITLKGDGTGQSIDAEETSDFKWELTNNGFKTTGGLKTTFTDDGDNITTKVIGVTITFVKQQ